MTRTEAVRYDGVRVDYDAFTAIPHLDLSIEEGEFFTLLGPSGCGKTTALRAVAGFISPSAGRIYLGGKDITQVSSAARGVGMVFQNYALFPSMNVRQNIGYGLQVQRVSRADRDKRVTEVARRVDLSAEQLEKPLTDLSGGQQQRVAIARSMVMQPKILLLDEPLSNLDAKLRIQLRVELKTLQNDFGITTIYVTHDQDEALTMSDRIAVFNKGRVEQVGTPEEVYSDPATEFVCTFVGETSRLGRGALRRLGLPDVPSYLRLERPRLTAGPATVPIEGTLKRVAYHGIHSRYTVRLDDSEFKVLAGPNSALHSPGDNVTVHIDPADVKQFDSEGRRMTQGVQPRGVPA